MRKTVCLEAVLGTQGIPKCACGGVIKPEVVLYEEMLNEAVLQASVRAIAGADLLIIGGTSLNVYPAAGLLRYYDGRDLVVINKTPTPADRNATLVLTGLLAKFSQKSPHLDRRGVALFDQPFPRQQGAQNSEQNNLRRGEGRPNAVYAKAHGQQV